MPQINASKEYLSEENNSGIRSLESYLNKLFSILNVNIKFMIYFKERLQDSESEVHSIQIINTFNKLLSKYRGKLRRN